MLSQTDVLQHKDFRGCSYSGNTTTWKQTKLLLHLLCKVLPSGLNAADNGVGYYASDSDSSVADGIMARHRSWKHQTNGSWTIIY